MRSIEGVNLVVASDTSILVSDLHLSVGNEWRHAHCLNLHVQMSSRRGPVLQEVARR